MILTILNLPDQESNSEDENEENKFLEVQSISVPKRRKTKMQVDMSIFYYYSCHQSNKNLSYRKENTFVHILISAYEYKLFIHSLVYCVFLIHWCDPNPQNLMNANSDPDPGQ